MFLKLFLLLVTVPLLELVILLVLGSEYGFGLLPTLAIVLLTGIVGAWLAQWQGTLAFSRIRRDLAEGKMPTDSVMDAVLIFFAGAFLMTPGILTDVLGFTFLIPGGRKLVKRYLTHWFKTNFKIETMSVPGSGNVDDDDVIDSHAVNSHTTDSPSASSQADSRPSGSNVAETGDSHR